MFEWSIVWLTSQNGNLTGQLWVKSKSPSPHSNCVDMDAGWSSIYPSWAAGSCNNGTARGAARGKLMVATASSMEFRLAATSGRKLHARIHDDAAAASRHSMKVAFSDSLWHSSCVKMNWRLQLCFFNSYSNSIWHSSCVILNPSMQLPWRLKNFPLLLPVSFLSTWCIPKLDELFWMNSFPTA